MDSGPPAKQYLKIGEVSRLTSLNSSVLRFWETEFETLRPLKSRTGQRLYSKQDLDLVLRIKSLLYVEKLTIAGAKSRISKAMREETLQAEQESSLERKIRVLEEVRKDLINFRDSL
jgi:DNA-binding transcriptional MerR regulator